MTPAEALLAVVVATFVADFLSGLWHLFIDFYPLNYAAGVDKVYFYQGDRNSPEFLELSRSILGPVSTLDKLSYRYKIHHVKPKAVAKYGYNQVFLDTAPPAFVLILCALGWMALFGPGFQPVIPLMLLVMGGLIGHIEFIHSCVHDSPRFPRGRKVVALLQRLRLIYATETHTKHHRGDGLGFCFLTGHTNFLVTRICAFLLRSGVVTDDRWHGRP